MLLDLKVWVFIILNFKDDIAFSFKNKMKTFINYS